MGTSFSIIGTSGRQDDHRPGGGGPAVAPVRRTRLARPRPGWAEAIDDEVRDRIEPLLATEAWVVDGNYERKLGDFVLERADTVVWLDLPLALKLARTLRRTAGRIARREDLWNGNRESIRNAFFARDSLFSWLIKSHRRQRREVPARLSRPGLGHLRVVRLRTPADVRRWLSTLSPNE
jgi:adenylate kinase family enzyme